jgi:hypothetical protein
MTKMLKQPPMIAFNQPPNLKSIMCHAQQLPITQKSQQESNPVIAEINFENKSSKK